MAANSRSVSTRKSAARKTATPSARPARVTREADPDVEDYDDDVEPAEAQELEATGKHITVALRGEAMRVVPAGAWPVSAQRALRLGDFDTFMEAVLHEDDYEEYEAIDPTLDEINLFIEDAGKLSGESRGKSRGPERSSRRTRRR